MVVVHQSWLLGLGSHVRTLSAQNLCTSKAILNQPKNAFTDNSDIIRKKLVFFEKQKSHFDVKAK